MAVFKNKELNLSILGQLKAFSMSCFLAFIFVVLSFDAALAQETANDIAENVITSSEDLPGLIAALSYGLGILAGVMGVLKLKAHVENPQNAPLNQAIIRIALAGALFALPIIYEAAFTTIDPDNAAGTVELQGQLDEIGGSLAIGNGGGNTELNDLASNVVESTSELPGLISGLAYLLGVLLAVLGLLKIKESVDVGSSQPTVAATALRAGVIRILAAGALFALPMIYEAVDVMISDGTNELTFDNNAIANDISGFMGLAGTLVPTLNFNNILSNIIDASNELPAVVSAVAYLMGLLLAVSAILKTRDHVENPDQTSLKEPVIRFVIAGALFAIPAVYNAMFTTVGGDGLGIIGNITSILGAVGFLFSGYGQSLCTPGAGVLGGALGGLLGQEASTGELLCDVLLHAGFLPAFLSALAYMIGLIFGIWGIFKIRDHVLNPQQTGIWEGISRFIAGGLFFALPVVVEVARNTLVPGALTPFAAAPVTGYNMTGAAGGGGILGAIGGFFGGAVGGAISAIGGLFGGGGEDAACQGLDGMLACFMADIQGPLHVVLNFFSFVAGMIFLMIGTSRLIKSAQDGARGPGGLGTIMTFVVGAGLISYNEIIRAFSTSLTGSATTNTYAVMQYTDGMTTDEIAAAHIVISSIIQFMILVGLISFVRGLFIIRSVAEGNQQASIMAGMTHLIGGTLAVNLGPLINAVQVTLGITEFGIEFS